MNPESRVSQLHYEIIRGLLQEGSCPANQDLAARLKVDQDRLAQLLRELSDLHGVVLHPHICAPWVVHPFSLTPTLNWVAGREHGWWAPCVWCAFGVATLAGGELSIHTRIGAEGDTLVLAVRDGEPKEQNGTVVHFAIPPARAWNNVHQHCALVLPFRSAREVSAWCRRHRQPEGEVVPLSQVASLARIWYAKHAKPTWRKWTAGEAREIFSQVGLRSPFWDLGEQAGRF